MDPTVVSSSSSSAPPSGPSDSSQYNLYSLGTITVQATGYETSPEVQAIWNEQVAIITDVMSSLNKEPVTFVPGDLDRLVGALKELEKLAQQGVTDETGKTYYLTQDMAEGLNELLYQFSLVGITPNLNTSGMSDTAKIALLKSISTPNATQDNALVAAVKQVDSLKYEDLGFQSYIFTLSMEIMNGTSSDFEELNEYLSDSDEVLDSLDELVEISSYVEPPEVWLADMGLSSPADIPPSAVGEIQAYIEKSGPNSEELMFQQRYNEEYAAAQSRAAVNGTTVQEEMKNAANYPPYTVNGVRTDVKTSAEILGSFVGNEGDSDRYTDVAQIMQNSVVQELNSVPTPPDGQSMSQVGLDIWETKTELETEYASLVASGASAEITDPILEVINGIDTLWTNALKSAGLPLTLTPEQAIAQGQLKVVEDFAVSFITSTQPGTPGSTALNKSVQSFQGWNEELQKEFQKLVTLLDNLVKMTGMLIKEMRDIAKSYIQKFN